MIESGIAYITLRDGNWRLFLAVSGVPVLILGVFFFFLPESPRYLAAKGEKEKVLKTLKRLARVNKKSLPPGELLLEEFKESSKNNFDIQLNEFSSKSPELSSSSPETSSPPSSPRESSEVYVEMKLDKVETLKQNSKWFKFRAFLVKIGPRVKRFKVFQLFATKQRAITTLITLMLWFMNVFAYYGVNFSSFFFMKGFF